jgi:hypothetical protein
LIQSRNEGSSHKIFKVSWKIMCKLEFNFGDHSFIKLSPFFILIDYERNWKF